jgi:hypothetical protein
LRKQILQKEFDLDEFRKTRDRTLPRKKKNKRIHAKAWNVEGTRYFFFVRREFWIRKGRPMQESRE